MIGGGVAAGLILLLSSYLWAVQAIAVLTPPPPLWSGALVGSLCALAAPVVTYLIWRGDSRAKVPMDRRIQRAEVVGSLLGFLSLLIFLSALPAA